MKIAAAFLIALALGTGVASAQTYGSGATTNCPVQNCIPAPGGH